MQEITVNHWCDLCGPANRVEAQSQQITVNGKVLGIDLCDKHYDDTLGRIVDVATVTLETDSSGHGKSGNCPLCGKHFAGLSAHVNRAHPGAVPTGWLACEQCSAVAPNDFSMTMHMSRTHR